MSVLSNLSDNQINDLDITDLINIKLNCMSDFKYIKSVKIRYEEITNYYFKLCQIISVINKQINGVKYKLNFLSNKINYDACKNKNLKKIYLKLKKKSKVINTQRKKFHKKIMNLLFIVSTETSNNIN